MMYQDILPRVPNLTNALMAESAEIPAVTFQYLVKSLSKKSNLIITVKD